MSQLCFGCMRLKENTPVCEHCGYDERLQNQSHQLPIGTMLQNQYLIGRVLGQGGFGITYMGWDQHLSVPVAIKEYYPAGIVHRHTQLGRQVICDNGQSPEVYEKYKDRFLNEARTLAMLSDIPEIVQIRNFFAENGTAYIVMEYVQGITLKEYLKKQGRPLTEKETLDILEPVLRALQKVHALHLIHRDISPDNIMLPDSGGIKLIDFGTARYVDESGKSQSTESILKPGFAPMEQYNTHGNLGTWTDVYAISASCHYLLTGKVPADVHERMDAGEGLTELYSRTEISRRTISVLENGMKLRIPDRIQTVDELYQQLYSQEQSKKEKKPRWILPVAAAVVVTVAAAVMLLQPKQAVTPEITEPTEEAAQTAIVPEPLTPEEEQYQKALALMGEGEYTGAAMLFAQLDTYKDSFRKEEECYLWMQYVEADALEKSGESGKAAIAFGKLVGFEDARDRSYALWKQLPGRETLSEWYSYLLAVQEDGRVVVDSVDPSVSEEALDTYYTADYENIVSIHGLVGLKCDGTLAVPNISQFRELEEWDDLVGFSMRYYGDRKGNTFVGLKSDGTVIISGFNKENSYDVSDWTDIVQVEAGLEFILGRTKDGNVRITGINEFNVFAAGKWTDIVDISSYSRAHLCYGLHEDGTVVTAGVDQNNDRVKVYQWGNVVSLHDNFAICEDGKVYSTTFSEKNLSGWTDVISIIYPDSYQKKSVPVGLRKDGTLAFLESGENLLPRAHTWKNLLVP